LTRVTGVPVRWPHAEVPGPPCPLSIPGRVLLLDCPSVSHSGSWLVERPDDSHTVIMTWRDSGRPGSCRTIGMEATVARGGSALAAISCRLSRKWQWRHTDTDHIQLVPVGDNSQFPRLCLDVCHKKDGSLCRGGDRGVHTVLSWCQEGLHRQTWWWDGEGSMIHRQSGMCLWPGQLQSASLGKGTP